MTSSGVNGIWACRHAVKKTIDDSGVDVGEYMYLHQGLLIVHEVFFVVEENCSTLLKVVAQVFNRIDVRSYGANPQVTSGGDQINFDTQLRLTLNVELT